MAKYRRHLPQLGDDLFLTDGGLETSLVYQQGINLPCFAAFDLLKNDEGLDVLRRYFYDYVAIARRYGVGVVLESPTWRANADWAHKLGYDAQALADANRRSIGLLLEIRAHAETASMPMVISGNIGPRGDGYRADTRMTAAQARDYHAQQIRKFADTDADMVSAFTLNYVDEAVGVVQAARDASMPVVISFTVETDGRLPSGETLAEVVENTDALTDGYAAYYMINCAHPTHFGHVLARGAGWRERIRGLRANASRCSHAELDACTTLDAGDPAELALQYHALRALLPRLNVLGGCCGTDHRHVEAIFAAAA
jgi:S-methylmethionine-dependent homocysteine/selenocysteine methylase